MRISLEKAIEYGYICGQCGHESCSSDCPDVIRQLNLMATCEVEGHDFEVEGHDAENGSEDLSCQRCGYHFRARF